MRRSLLINFIAGLSVFLTMSYIAFVNPFILSKAGLSPLGVFFATCGLAALGSIALGWGANVPTALAPAMGMNVMFVEYVAFMKVPWQVALAMCAFASLIFFVFSFTHLRRNLIDAIPASLKIAVTSAIGAILIDVSLNTLLIDRSRKFLLSDARNIDRLSVILFIVGLIALLVFDLFLKRRRAAPGAQTVLPASAFGPIVSIVLISGLMYVFSPATFKLQAASGSWWIWTGQGDATANAFTPENVIVCIPLMLAVLYLLLSDIVGTAYDPRLVSMSDSRRDTKIARAFNVDSLFSLVSGAAGSTPTVCYGENHVGPVVARAATDDPRLVEDPGRLLDGSVAVVVGLCFGVLGLVGVWLALQGLSPTQLVPAVAIGPVLFYTGLQIIAQSLQDDISGRTSAQFPGRNDLRFWMPAAITIVFVQLLDLVFALGFGVLAFYIFSFSGSSAGDVRPTDPEERTSLAFLHLFSVLAFAAALIKFMLLMIGIRGGG